MAARFRFVPSAPLLVLAALALAVFCTPPVEAQEKTQESGYYVKGKNFVQRLSWPEDKNALRYEFIIERREESGDTEVFRAATTETFVEFSLPPGNYRCRVIEYNLLGQTEYDAPWTAFSILEALQPEIAGFNPRQVSGKDRIEITLEGKNLLPGSEPLLEKRGASLAPSSWEADPSGERGVLVFEPGELEDGMYRIRIQNPGGLQTAHRGLFVGESADGLRVSLVYSPFIPVAGYFFEPFTRSVFFLGAQIRGEYFFWHPSWGSLGAEAVLSWDHLRNGGNEPQMFAIRAHMGEVRLNLLYRRPLNSALDFKARFGGGVSGFLITFEFLYPNAKSGPIYAFSPLADMGGSVEWKFYRNLSAEAGIEAVLVLSRDRPWPFYIRPFMGLGWRF